MSQTSLIFTIDRRASHACIPNRTQKSAARTWPAALAVLLVCTFFGGCALDRRVSMQRSVQHFTEVDPAVVFHAAEEVLGGAGFRITRSDKANGQLTALPLTSAEDGPTTSRIGLSSARRTRRLAKVSVVESDGLVRVSCRVEHQELVTEATRMFEQQLGGFDRTDETPIDRGAATTESQNATWRATGNDRLMERRILTRISEALGEYQSKP